MKKSLLSIAVLTLLLSLFPRMQISSFAEENESTPQAPAGIQLVEGFESVSSIQPGDSRLADAQNRVAPLIYQNLTLFENCDIYEITLFVTGTIVDNDATNKNDPPIDDNTEYTLDILILDSASVKAGGHYIVNRTYTISVLGSEIKKNDWNTFDVSHLGITVKEGETLGFGSTSSTLEFFYLNSRVDSDLCYWGHNTTTGDTTLRLRKNFNLLVGVTGYNTKKAEQEAHCLETLQMLKEKLAGKYLSVFGASMCTYEGYSNDATTNSTIGNNKVYYTARQMNVEDTFWMQVVDDLDMKLLVNNSWSGSAVSFVRAGAQPSYLDRCRQLHADTGANAGTYPDIIVSFMGCNDYKQPGVILGTVSPEMLAIIDQNVNNDDYRGETFAECYAMMLARVVAHYPHAEVFVFNMPYTAKYSLEGAEAYHEVIFTIAEYYGCHVIDLAHSKMSGANYTPYSLDGLHPNAEGMDIWTELIIGEFIDCFLTNQSPEDHEYNRVDKQPTCVTQGFTQYTCVCGSCYIENKFSALGHSYDEGVVTAAPDCTSDGVKTFTCDTCGETYTETLLAIGHVEENIPAVAPTCTETGLTAGVKCSVCGEILTVQEEVPALGHNYLPVITDSTCTGGGYTTYTCSVCNDSYTADETPAAGHAYNDGVETTAPTYTKEGVKTFTCTTCGDTYTEVIPALDYSDSNPYKGKVFSIMGDSISTFAGYIPTADGFNRTHLARYPQDNLLTDVYATWWMQAIVDLDAKLGINDSWRGATVSGAHPVTSGDTGENAAMSNLVRIQNLGSNGTPDVILFYGGTNDIAHVSKIGSFDPESAPSTVDLTTMKWDSLADAYAHTLLRMKHYYPDAIILALLPTYTASYYSDARLAQANETLVDICQYYGVSYIDLRDCSITADDLPDGIHPGEHGMDLITAAVIDALLTIDVPEGENVVYSVTHNLSNATASRGYYKGISAGTSFEETLTGDNLSVTVTMGGKDITAACYSDGHVFIEKVTGALEITAKSPFSLGNHLQEIPSEAYNNTNLWQVLKPEKGYFKGAEWVSNYSSVTIPVTPGDQLWATSFGASGENGGSMNGIRVTYFDEYGMLATIEPDAVYDEFQQNGYLTVPEGATAVCITMWTNTNAELYLLTLPDGPVLPGSHLQSIPTPVCSGVNLWQVLKPEKGYFKGATWVDYYSSVTFPVVAGDQLWATSFGASGDNGGTINGIRVTYFDAHGMLVSLEATEVYEEFQENGCVTVPENAVSVNVVMWNGDASDELYILNLEHNYDDGVETLAPTCTADGVRTFTCEICGSISTDAIPAVGHTEEAIPAVAPTCTTTGLTEGSHCSVCNEVLIAQEGIDALGHSFAVVSIVPTPTAKGYSIYTCTQCSDSYRTAWLHENAYKGLKIACVGDSITAAYGVTKDKTDYVTLLAQNLGMDYIRLGVSGTTLCTDGSRTCNIGQLTESKLNGADVVTILMGINDFCATGTGYYELGDINSRDTSTIYGAMRMWCERIVQLQKTDSLSNTKFYFVTPVICSWNNSVTSGRNWDQSKTNIHGYTLRDMCNAIIEVANCYGISVIDLNILSGMYYVDAANNNTAVFGGDGVHPGEKGHAMMADALANILLQSDLRDDHSHVFGSWITTTWPSCRAGEQQRVCNICFATEGRPLEPNGSHRYRTAITTSTCETAGYTTYTCSICNDSYTADETPAAGHAYDDGVETLAPTCTADGVKTFTCEICGSISTEAIPAVGHTEEAIPAVAPSCTVTGLTEGVQCAICGEVLTVPSEVAALGHSHIAVITAPTCTEKGFTTYTCSTCGDSYVSDEVGATGHSYDDGVITTTPACTAGGIKTFTCEVCGDSYNEVVSATGHMEEANPAVAPTCTAPGLTAGVKCSACGEILTAQTEVAALGHSYDDGVETTAPTCTEEGIKTFTCTVCGNAYTEVIAATSHNYTPLVTDSTCTGVGYTTYTCSACGDSYTSDETPASGHSYDAGVVTAAPTCTKEGVKSFICSACGIFYTESVPATGHAQEIIPAVAPTCTETGLTTGMKCSVCGEILTAQTEVAALGHSYNSGVETTEPSCTAAGVKTFTCGGCGNSYTEVLPALGHTEITLPAVAPTCTTVGKTEGLHCNVCGTVFTPQDILPALGHTEGEPVISVEPTVQTAGIRSAFCDTCGELIRSESITVTGSLYIPGDADDNGRVDIYDALLVMQYSAGWDVTPNLLNANISKDGIVDLYDAVMILQYCAGTSFDSALRALLEKAEELLIDVMTILEHPQDQHVIEGQQAVFRLSAAGAGLQYQWYIDRGNGDSWRPIAGATSDTYTISATQMNDDGCRYRCRITDASGRQIMSNPATLYVEPAVELPPTGDHSNPLLWTTLMAVSLCGLIGLFVADIRYSMSK